MSAIWGYISKGRELTNELVTAMGASMSGYKLDRIEEINQSGVYFACGHQYITPEAVTDVSPIYDSADDLYFAGDCFLYNRADVIRELKQNPGNKEILGDKSPETMGDALLAYYAYRFLGNDFVRILRGSFAFAIYREKERELHLFSDHLCKRYLAYYAGEDFVCFGSTYAPLKACLGTKLKLDRAQIISTYRNRTPMNFFEPEKTVYQDIYHLDNAVHVSIDLNTLHKKREIYWDPIAGMKKLHGKTDAEYQALFLETYQHLVQSHLRARKETGIMLSGGLDSASVAAYAAPYLEKQGKQLFSYTTVPSSQYQCNENSWMMENESYLIEEQRKRYPNLCPRYITGDYDNCLTSVGFFQKIYGIPVKPSINNVNIDKMGAAAGKDSCSILLSGANGNATVSYGKIGEYISLTIRKGHFIRALKEMFRFCKKHKLSRKKYFMKWVKLMVTHPFMLPPEDDYYLRREDVKKYHLDHLQREARKTFGDEYCLTERQKDHFIYIPGQYIQKGFYYTCQGLQYGYLQLDPTLTVEMVELCLSLPNECFVHNGTERRLIRDYMKELIPYPIIDDKKKFGVQAADFAYRVNRDWDQVKDSVYDILSEPVLREYLDGEKLDKLLETIHTHEYDLDKVTVCDTALICSLGCFLRDFYAEKDADMLET